MVDESIFHGVMNASEGIPLMYVKGGDDLIVGMTGLAGFISLALLNILLFVYDRYMAKEKVIIR